VSNARPQPAEDSCRGVRCPKCSSGWSSVSHTRKLPLGRVRRYRQCMHCRARFSTTEASEAGRP